MSKIFGMKDLDLDELEGDDDFTLALQLQLQMDADEDDHENAEYNTQFKKSPAKFSPYKKQQQQSSPLQKVTLNDPQWELIDPCPDIRSMFQEFDKKYFWSSLGSCIVEWSKRMTICAGIFYLREGGIIRLSEPLLKYRPRKDLVETLLHEMIHAYLYITRNFKDRGEHGDEFKSHMKRINHLATTNITVYHSFHEEVRNCRQHVWRCTGGCRQLPPFYGYVKRAMNRAPGKNDRWWAQHKSTCNGHFEKISEPESFKEKNKAKLNETNNAIKSKTTKALFTQTTPNTTKNLNSYFFSQSKTTMSQISSFPDSKLKADEYFKLGSPKKNEISPFKQIKNSTFTNFKSKSSPDLTAKLSSSFKTDFKSETQKTPVKFTDLKSKLSNDDKQSNIKLSSNLNRETSGLFKLGKSRNDNDYFDSSLKKRKSDTDEEKHEKKNKHFYDGGDDDLKIVHFINKKPLNSFSNDVIVIDSKSNKFDEGVNSKHAKDNDLITELFNKYSECPVCGQKVHEDIVNSHVNGHF